MTTIQIFEPALCCNTGVCGDDVDQALVTFSADLDWLKSQGGDIRRYNLASEPRAFAENESVRRFLEVAGSQGLPLVLVDGTTISTGAYPRRQQLATWAGLGDHEAPENSQPARDVVAEGRATLDLSSSVSCCGGGSTGTEATEGTSTGTCC